MSVDHRDALLWPLQNTFKNKVDYSPFSEASSFSNSFLNANSQFGVDKDSISDSHMGYWTPHYTQTKLKESSPTSMISDKSSSRGTLEARNFDNSSISTDIGETEHPISEGSLSPPAHRLTLANNSQFQSSSFLRPATETCVHNVKQECINSTTISQNVSHYTNLSPTPTLERLAAPQISSTNINPNAANLCFYKPQTYESLPKAQHTPIYEQPNPVTYVGRNNFHRTVSSSALKTFPNNSSYQYGVRQDYSNVKQSAYQRNQLNYRPFVAPEHYLPDRLRNYDQTSASFAIPKKSFTTSYEHNYNNDAQRYVESNLPYQSYRQKNLHSPCINTISSELYPSGSSVEAFEAKQEYVQHHPNYFIGPDDRRVRCSINPNSFIPTNEPARQRSYIGSDIFSHPIVPTEISSAQMKRHMNCVSDRSSKSYFEDNLTTASNSENSSLNLNSQPIHSSMPKSSRGQIEGVKKRKAPSTSRMSKRRRMSNENEQKVRQNASAISETQATLALVRLLSRNLSQCISTPVLENNIELCPPVPAFNKKMPCHKFDTETTLSTLEMNSIFRTNYGNKYSTLPFTIRNPKKSSPNSLMSYLTDGPTDFFTQNNLLNNALNLAFLRADNHDPGPIPLSPFNLHAVEIDPLHIYKRPEHILLDSDIPLSTIKRQYIASRNSSIANTPKTDKIHNIISNMRDTYLEKKHTSDTLKPKNCSNVCSFCAMQLLPGENIDQSSNSMANVFCSETCRYKYNTSISKQRHNKLTSISYSTNSIYSDHIISKVPILIHGSVAKLCKNSIKTSANKLGRRKMYPQEKNNVTLNVPTRRWQGSRWIAFATSRLLSCLSRAEIAPSFETANWLRPLIVPKGKNQNHPAICSSPKDERMCDLCKERGDSDAQLCGRLLNYDIDKWLHVNCILWCYDTYETQDGCLMNVARSLEKANREKCTHCHLLGAGLPCFAVDCPFVYHLSCASKIGCIFYEDRSMFCPSHQNQVPRCPKLDTLEVLRRVFLSKDEYSLVADVVGNHPQIGIPRTLRIGSLILNSIGQLLPEHLESGMFHTSSFIYPIGFSTTRIYWSYRRPGHRCFYTCSITDSTHTINHKGDHWIKANSNLIAYTCPIFTVTANDPEFPEECFRGHSCNEVWQHILNTVQTNRKQTRFTSLNLFSSRILGEELFGLSESHIVRAIESLPGVEHVRNYVFKFGKMQLITKMPMVVNPTGCARSEPKLRTYIRNRNRDQDVVSQAPSIPSYQLHHVSQIPRTYSPSSCTAPIGKQSSPILSKFHQYRRLRFDWKNNVLLARSKIQGLGLYAARDIEKHEFIIEYLGQLIRNEVGNRRECLYDSQNRGIYMFRADDDCIVDATLYGGLARYINHSCEPNCIAEVFAFETNKRIIIIAKRLIKKGEELTYDYQFDFEDDKPNRIPCLCGAKLCKKWIN